MSKRDPVYEEEISRHIERITAEIDVLATKPELTSVDFFALERLLQLLIEAFIGLCRYTLKRKLQNYFVCQAKIV